MDSHSILRNACSTLRTYFESEKSRKDAKVTTLPLIKKINLLFEMINHMTLSWTTTSGISARIFKAIPPDSRMGGSADDHIVQPTVDQFQNWTVQWKVFQVFPVYDPE